MAEGNKPNQTKNPSGLYRPPEITGPVCRLWAWCFLTFASPRPCDWGDHIGQLACGRPAFYACRFSHPSLFHSQKTSGLDGKLYGHSS